jgi:hypothetical protein
MEDRREVIMELRGMSAEEMYIASFLSLFLLLSLYSQ